MTYCQEIHPVPTEYSWIVSLDITQREIPPPYVDSSKPERRTYKIWRGVGESFSTRKIKCSVCRNFCHKKTTRPNRNAPLEVLSIVLLNFNECSFLFEDDSII